PKYPPTPPEPMIAICNAHPPATSERSNTVPALAAQSVGGGAALRADAPDPGRSSALQAFLRGCGEVPILDSTGPAGAIRPSAGQGVPRGPLKVAYEDFENVPSSVSIQPVPARIRRDRACARPRRQGCRRLPALQHRADRLSEQP